MSQFCVIEVEVTVAAGLMFRHAPTMLERQRLGTIRADDPFGGTSELITQVRDA